MTVDKKMKARKKKIVLFIDNCTAHTVVPLLSNVKVIFLPANTTSKLQPLDQGIIHSFKRHYRREVVLYTLGCIEKNIKIDINVLQAMKFARKAWFLVSAATIQNCFKKAGFKQTNQTEYENEIEDTEDIDPVQWSSLLPEGSDNLTFDEFVNFDDNVAVSGELSDADIIAIASGSQDPADENEETSEESAKSETVFPSKSEALSALALVHRYFEGCSGSELVNFDRVYALEKAISCTKSTWKQTTLDSFFVPH